MTNNFSYSDRAGGASPPTREEITPAAWKGIVALVRNRIADGSLAYAFPMQCPDGSAIAETDESAFRDMLIALIPGLERPADMVYGAPPLLLDTEVAPSTPTALDVVDFVAQRVAEPHRLSYHGFFSHDHLGFDVPEGRARFRADIELVFARNGIAFTVGDDDRVRRLGPTEARQLISEFSPDTRAPSFRGLTG